MCGCSIGKYRLKKPDNLDLSIEQKLESVESLISDYELKQWRGRNSVFLGWDFAINLFNIKPEANIVIFRKYIQ